ncbi:hypothetical protein GCM10009799_31040 [Nocardiopsis rhodophaea]|uniref:Lipoprotein n=2 Tax=Nocardiopsis rhodophaea TaxID=280238 RepID=A0ABN2TAL5_9ACTN
MRRRVCMRTTAAGLLLSLLVGGCAVGGDEPKEPTTEIDTSPKAFTEYSGVPLPEGIKEPDITAEYDDQGNVVYNVLFSATSQQAEKVCEEVGNWLPRSQGVSEEEREKLGIDADAVTAAGDNVRGCSAVDQETGTHTEGIVLYPDDDSADVYLITHTLGR